MGEDALAAPEEPGGQRTRTTHEGTPACPTEGPRQCMSAWEDQSKGSARATLRSRGPGTVPTGQAGNPPRTQGTGQSAQRGPTSKGEWARQSSTDYVSGPA